MDKLKVKVVRGEDLYVKDLLGTSDPFVKLKLAGKTEQTNVIKKTHNPEWNETFSLDVKDPETDSLEISVYDWDKITRNDLIGKQVVSLKQLNPNILQTFTLDLQHVKKYRGNKTKRGRIILELEYQQTSLADSAEAIAPVEGKDAEAQASHEEPPNAAEQAIAEPVGEGIALVEGEDVQDLTTSDEDLDEGETTDEEALSPATGEAVIVEGVQDGEPGAGDETVNEEKLVEEAPLLDSAEAIPPVVGEDVESPTPDHELDEGETINVEDGDPGAGDEEFSEDKLAEAIPLLDSAEAIPPVVSEDAEPPTPDQDLHEGKTIDEEAQFPDTGEAIAVEDGDPGAGDEEVNEEENVAEETPRLDSSEAIPPVVGEDVDAPKPDHELDEGETIDEQAQSPETGEAIIVADGDPGAGDEDFNEDNLAEETPLLDSTEAIPPVKGEDVEASTPDQELNEGKTIDEESQSPETGEAVVLEAFEDGEPGARDEEVNEEEKLAEETPLVDSAEAVSPLKVEDVQAPTPEEELNEGKTIDEESQSPETAEAFAVEAIEDQEPGVGDEQVNEEEKLAEETLLDSAEAIPPVEGGDVDAPISDHVLDTEETIDEEAEPSRTGEAIVVEALEDREPGARDEEVNEEEKLSENTPLLDSAEGIAPVEGEDVEAPTSYQELDTEETIDEEAEPSRTGEAIVVEAFEDGEPGARDEVVNEEKLSEETTLLDSAEGIPPVEGDVEAATSDHELDTEETIYEEAEPSRTPEAIAVEAFEFGEPGARDEEVNEEKLAEETPLLDSAEAISTVEGEDVEAPTFDNVLDTEETRDKEAEPSRTGEAIVVKAFEDGEPGARDEVVNEEKLSEETTLLDSAEGIAPDEDEDVEAPTSDHELDTEQTIDEEAEPSRTGEAIVVEAYEVVNEEKLAEETLLLDSAQAISTVEGEDPTSDHVLDTEETRDEEAEPSRTSEAIVVEAFEDGEPGARDEVVNEEKLSEETTLLDSAESIAPDEGEDVEAPTSDHELDTEQTVDEEAEPSRTGEAIVVEAYEVVNEEKLAEETTLLDSAEGIPPVQGDVEAATSDQELDTEETRDEEAEPSRTGEAIVVEAFEEGEPGARDEEVNEEKLAEDTPLLDSAEAISPAEGEDVEAPTSDHVLDTEETRDEEAEPSRTGEAIVVEVFEDGELGARDQVVNEEKLAEETPLLDSAEAIAPDEGEDVEAPTSDQELDTEETIDEEAEPSRTGEAIVVEAFENGEPGARDEEVNGEKLAKETPLLDCAEAISPVEGEDVEAPTSNHELDTEETRDEEAEPSRTGEAIVVEAFEEGEPGTRDEEVNEEKLAEETPLLDSAEAISPVESEDVEAPISDHELDKGETALEEASSPEIGEAIVGAGDDEVNEENFTEEKPLTDSAKASREVEAEDVLPPTSEEKFEEGGTYEGGTADEEAQSLETGEAIVDVQDGEPGVGVAGINQEENVAGQTSVPLSTHTADLSFSAWDVDAESNGTKFPFSIFLCCSQPFAKLFGGHQK